MINGKKLSIDQFARDKVRMIIKVEFLLLCSLQTPLDSANPWGKQKPSLGHLFEFVRGWHKVAANLSQTQTDDQGWVFVSPRGSHCQGESGGYTGGEVQPWRSS